MVTESTKLELMRRKLPTTSLRGVTISARGYRESRSKWLTVTDLLLRPSLYQPFGTELATSLEHTRLRR